MASNIPRAFAAGPGPAPLPLSLASLGPSDARLSAPAKVPKVVLPPKRKAEADAAAEEEPNASVPEVEVSASTPKAAQPSMAHDVESATAMATPKAGPPFVPPTALSATALATPKAKAAPSTKKEPQPSPRVRAQELERGMIVAYQETVGTSDARVGTVESVFPAINEVWIVPEDMEEDDTTVRCSTTQVTFLGSWSKTLEIINSIDVPPDLEVLIGAEQMEQVQDLAKEVPCHLEPLPEDAMAVVGAMAQLVFGPAPARSVKLAVEAVVSQVEGLEFPDANMSRFLPNLSDPALANAMPWAVPQLGGAQPVVMVPVWPTAAGWTADYSMGAWQSMAGTGSVPSSVDWTQGDLSVPEPVAHDAAPDDAAEDASEAPAVTPPWRQQELPPPPKRAANGLNSVLRVKRFRRVAAPAMAVKEEIEQDTSRSNDDAGVKTEPGSLLDPSTQDERFPDASGGGVKTENDSSFPDWASQANSHDAELWQSEEIEQETQQGTSRIPVPSAAPVPSIAPSRKNGAGVKTENDASSLDSEKTQSRSPGPSAVPVPSAAPSAAPSKIDGEGAGASTDSSLLYWAKRQHLFKDLPALPDGWIRVSSKTSGGIYFVNLSTGQATFDWPSDLPPGWEVVTSKSTGKQYYWNAALQISQFERPT